MEIYKQNLPCCLVLIFLVLEHYMVSQNQETQLKKYKCYIWKKQPIMTVFLFSYIEYIHF